MGAEYDDASERERIAALFRQCQESSMAIDRPTGYYWIVFPGQEDRWQPGGWDNQAKMWSVMGGRDLWFEQQLVEVGEKIKQPLVAR